MTTEPARDCSDHWPLPCEFSGCVRDLPAREEAWNCNRCRDTRRIVWNGVESPCDRCCVELLDHITAQALDSLSGGVGSPALRETEATIGGTSAAPDLGRSHVIDLQREAAAFWAEMPAPNGDGGSHDQLVACWQRLAADLYADAGDTYAAWSNGDLPSAECDGRCLSADDLGVHGYSGLIAYPDPECTLHGGGQGPDGGPGAGRVGGHSHDTVLRCNGLCRPYVDADLIAFPDPSCPLHDDHGRERGADAGTDSGPSHDSTPHDMPTCVHGIRIAYGCKLCQRPEPR